MKLENQVCTLEQAKRLKELGVLQYSYFSWCGEEGQRLMDNGRDGMAVQEWVFVANTEPVNNMQADHRENVPGAKPFAAAYTVAELGEMLPEWIYKNDNEYRFKQWHNVPEQYSGDFPPEIERAIGFLCCYQVQNFHSKRIGTDDGTGLPFRYATEAEARAAMLIYLIENKLVSVDQINKRITP